MRITTLLVTASSLVLTSTSFADGLNCYHKIGGVCKSGYASGYQSDCSTPCNTGLKPDKDAASKPSKASGDAKGNATKGTSPDSNPKQ